MNAVGLANPGLEAVRTQHLPWLASHLPNTRKIVNVVGFATDEFAHVVSGLEEVLGGELARAVDGYEINVSCPNVKAGGMEFGADPAALELVVAGVRRATHRPVFVKLSPTLANIGEAAQNRGRCRGGRDQRGEHDSRVVDRRRAPPPGSRIRDRRCERPGDSPGRRARDVEGARSGPVADHRRGRRVVRGGRTAVHHRGCFTRWHGTAAMRDPRAPERVVAGLEQWCARHNVPNIQELTGTLEWPA
jgi:Dihydroorotate dehydrogenase